MNSLTQILWGDAQDEAEINVDQMAIRMKQNVSIMSKN